MRKVITLVILLGFICSAVFASITEYDLGGGQTLLLHEDGTYEIITSQVEVDRIVGRQYKLDLMRSIDPFITLAPSRFLAKIIFIPSLRIRESWI